MTSRSTTNPVLGSLAQKRALLAQRLQNVARQRRESPLSFAQQRLWFLDQLEPNSALYNIGAVAQIDGLLDSAALQKSLDILVARHETLRTRFTCPDETPVQTIDPPQPVSLQIHDLAGYPQQDRDQQAHRLIRGKLSQPFNLSSDHPLRASLVKLGPERYQLILILHHIIADEWSLRVLSKELGTIYTCQVGGKSDPLPPLAIQYSDYARWQRRWLQGQVLERQLSYWKKQLSGFPPATELLTDRPRGAVPTFNGATVVRVLGTELSAATKALAERQQATMYMVLLAAFKVLVQRYTRQDDLIVCSPVAGRNRVEIEGLIGFFVNTLALRTDLGGDPSFIELLARVREVVLGAMAHQDLPFERVVEELQPERTLTHLPFTRLMFTLQTGIPEQIELPSARMRILDVDSELSKFDLTLVFRETAEGLVAKVEYNRDLFDAATIERLLGHLETLLKGIVQSPELPVSQLPMLTSAERRQLLVDWNQTAAAYPSERCIHEIFEEQVRRAPEAVALTWGVRRMSYTELNSRANQLARFLAQFGIQADQPIGLCVNRSMEMVVGMIGILKAGGAYVPLDPNYPKERLAFMIADSGVTVVLTQQHLLERVPRSDAKLICLDADWELIGRQSRENTNARVQASNLAYVMYTSGTTGNPKGVAIPHRAVNRLVLNNDFIRLSPSDRIAQVSNISFDAATFELWGALLNGAQLMGITRDVALSPKDFASELRDQGITAMFLTAALFNQLAAEAPGAFERLNTLIAGGEPLDPKWVRAVLRDRPPRRLLNGYGPTENTTFTCCHELRSLPEWATTVPIGKAISNTTVYVLDSRLNPVPIGVPGELYTGGDGLASGYWKQPELTAEKFIRNPFDVTGGSCLYRTGDLARYLPDGTLEFLGRIDQQVKIRGFRIELSEIETVLGQHPGVNECVVAVAGSDSRDRRLIAYLAPAPQQAPSASELRSFLEEKLPDYMIPSAFVSMSHLPLTPNGKVDRKALPAPDQNRPKLDHQYVGPRDATERQLVTIWESVLAVRPIGVRDKFFDLGGHSMLAVRVIAQIEKAFGKKLRLATLFQAPTIERLAAILREEVKESNVAADTSLVEIQGAGSRPPLFLVHGAGGGMFWGYVNLARELGTDQPVYGFRSRGLDGHEEFARIEDMAARYIADLRKVQPCGPYYLGGYCFGGNVAYEMACQLTEVGEQVALLAVLNCAPPHSRYAKPAWTLRWAVKFARNLVYWANYFRHWSKSQRREFFRWKWHLLKKRIARARNAGSGDFSRIEPGDLVDLSSYTEEQKVVWESHIRGLMNFQPRAYSGQVYLFRSPGHPLWCSFDDDYGWSDLVHKRVQFVIVPGAHEKILEKPWVQTLARDLSRVLKNAQEAFKGGHQGKPTPGLEFVNGHSDLRGNGHTTTNGCTGSPHEPQTLKFMPRETSLSVSATLITNGSPEKPKPRVVADIEPDSIVVSRTITVSNSTPADSIGFGSKDSLETYPQLFARELEKYFNRVAVRFQGQEISYEELDQRSNQLAHYLRELGVKPEVLVAMAVERSLELPIAMLGVLKAGGAYLPLDPNYPADRLSFMLKDARPGVMLAQSNVLSRLTAPDLPVVCLDQPQQQAIIAQYPKTAFESSATSENLAYVIYTSGSTGVPKGVQITHHSMASHNLAVREAFHLTPNDRVLQFTPLSFDISVEEIFPTWLSGSMLILRSEMAISSMTGFFQHLIAEEVTVLNLPTAYWHELVDFLDTTGATLPESLRLIIIGGEKASDEAYRKWKKCVGGKVTLLNGYGATEATITSTLYQARLNESSLPIGRPLGNTEIAVLDAQLRAVPPGVDGELFIGGAGLGRGYLNRPELTAQSFITNPIPSLISSPRLYKTGDLVRVRADGNLEYVGRVDDQVKIRGYRIELGEIETVLREHPELKDAAVVIREELSGNKRVIGYYVPRSQPGPGVRQILSLLKKKLPGYMLPSALVRLEALPLTPAGKIDRRALPAPGNSRPNLEQEYVAPGTALEEQLANIWSEVLEVSPVGIQDNFVELGGHSLLATKAISRIRTRFQVEVSLKDFFALPTISDLAQHLRSLIGSTPNLLTVPPTKGRRLPLSSIQERIWLLDQFDPKRTAYNRSVVVRLQGTLNLEPLERSLLELIKRHEALRAVFPLESGRPTQQIIDPDATRLQVIDLSSAAEPERVRRAQELVSAEGSRSHILSQTVLRPLLLRLNATEHWLVLIVNDVAVDEESVRVILKELPRLYASAVERPQQLQIGDSDCHQATALNPLEGDIEREQLTFWRQQLDGVPELLDLPADRPRPAQVDFSGARHSVFLDAEIGRAIAELATQQNCHPACVFLGAFSVLLQRYTGNSDIVIGSTASQRAGGAEGRVGCFENPVALRCNLEGDPPFRQLIDRFARVRRDACQHSAVPFGKIVADLRPQCSASYTPVFQVFLAIETEGLPELSAGGIDFSAFEVDNRTSKFDLSLRLVKDRQGFAGWLEYSTGLFDPARIARLAEHWQTLLRSAVFEPDKLISKLELLPQHEASRLLVDWNNTAKPYAKSKRLLDLFLEQVELQPAAEALICGQSRLTYSELYKRARRIASHLETLGVSTGSLVGLCLERTPDVVAAMLGTFLVRAAYVPLDPKYPKDRLSVIMQDANVQVLLTQSTLLSLVPQTASSIVCLDTLGDSDAVDRPERSFPAGQGTDLAYVIYTSGSTGKPKGVAIEHRNAVALIAWAHDTFTAEELSGVLASTSICFDLSVFELFVPLCCGGKVILAENALALAGHPSADEVRLINTVPSAIRELLRLRAVPATVQVINLAGEPLSTELVDQIYRETAVRKVYDLYGPTETTTYSTGTLRISGMPATIGRPLPNEQVYLLDTSLRPVPIGIPGELFIGGDGVARGYLNRPELTAEKFIADPFNQGGRLYRTGDLARWREDGQLEYLGRIDHQVKIRGFRIELGEIESVLKEDPAVSAVVVVAREDHPGDRRIAAYLVARSGATLSIDDLKRRIRQRLPDFMMPSDFIVLDALPMTPNGKIDRKALPPPQLPSNAASSNDTAPRNALEEQLAAIWREVLRLKDVSVQDNFFDLGGHSLFAVRVISAIRDTFKVELPLSAIFSAPTIAALCEVLSALQSQQNQSLLPPITAIARSGRLPVSYVQERLWLLDQLNPGSPAYNVPLALRLHGVLNRSALQQAVNQVVSRHEALRSSFHYDNEGITLTVADSLSLDVACADLRPEPAEQREKLARDLLDQEARRSFDLATGPLIRATLIQLEETEHLLLVVMHHTVSDGWSLALFFQELGSLYDVLAAGPSSVPLPSLPIQYVDFAHWQRQWMGGAVLENELTYWKEALEGAPPELALPLDHARPSHPSGRARSQSAFLEKPAIESVLGLARREGCTPFMFFLASLMITLEKWTGQDDLVIGTVVAGRTRRALENIIGCFMNFLPLRARLRQDETGKQALAKVRKAVLEGQSHQNCPFQKIVEAVNPQRAVDQNPLYNVALLLQNFPPNLFQTETLQASIVPVCLEAALLDLRFEIEQVRDGFSLTCEYKTDLFEPGTIEALLKSWLNIIGGVSSSPELPVNELKLAPGLAGKAPEANSTAKTSRLILASTFTAEPIADSIGFWSARLGLQTTIEFAPFNQVFQQLLDPTSDLRTNRHGLNIILARIEDWLRAEGSGTGALQETLQRNGREFVSALQVAASHSSVPFLVYLCPPSPAFTKDNEHALALSEISRQLERDLNALSGVYLLTNEELAKWYPVPVCHDAVSEELGKVPYTAPFFTALGTALMRKFSALSRPACKVIALDCDNTLWSGVCGEVGPAGIELDGPRRALQEFMRAQRDSGMLLCLCSKNNEEDVQAVFVQRKEMPLGLGHFAASRLNWQPKSANLKSLAQELGLGLDSFIFIDDNPVECAEVQANCPEVLTLQLPEDPRLVESFLNHCWAFDHLKLTVEDRRRADLYAQNRDRERLRAETPTLEAFLASLELKVAIAPIEPQERARVAQLTQRTNQFNFTTCRRTEEELGQWLKSGHGLAVKVSDRFGDYGLVGVTLYGVEPNSIAVDSFLLSCRVLGRGVEHQMVARLGEIALQQGIGYVDLHFSPSPKNKPALDFLDRACGAFKQPGNGGSLFRLPADFAAALKFRPVSSDPAKMADKADKNGLQLQLHPSRPGSSSLAQIALESNDVSEIHQQILNRASIRKRERANFTAARNELERKLCALWEQLLHVEPVGIEEDFFALGGHSLLAVRLFAEIEKILGRKFPLVTIFQAPTIAQLARVLEREDNSDSLLVPIQPRGAKPPLFLVHGAGGDVLWGYANLAAHLHPEQPIYGIKSQTAGGLAAQGATLEQMACSYLAAVKARQPTGPYFFGGYCFGGNVAYEMARQLELQGEEVGLVVLIDTAPANAGYEQVRWWRPSFPFRFARNLRYWLADFFALDASERRRFASRKLRWVGRKLVRRLGLGPRQQQFDLEEVIDLEKFPIHELNLWQAHLEALIAHIERPYRGRVALLRTHGQALLCSLEEDFCWGKLVTGGIQVRCIPGSHESIFMEPNVQRLAAELQTLLNESQNGHARAVSFERNIPVSN